jgi:hypothetical protein
VEGSALRCVAARGEAVGTCGERVNRGSLSFRPVPTFRLSGRSGTIASVKRVGVLSALLLLGLAVATLAQGAWTTLAPMPSAREWLGAATGLDGRIYAIGGNYLATLDNRDVVEAYEPSSATWVTVAPMPTPRNDLATATGPDGRIYAIGGFGPESPPVPLDTVECYDPSTHVWSPVAPMPTARGAARAATGPDGRIYAIGGLDSSLATVNTVEAYDTATGVWSAVAAMPTPRSAVGAAVGGDGRIYVMGGQGVGSTIFATTEAYDPSTNTWTTVAPMPTARRGLCAASGLDGHIYAIGGLAPIDPLGTVESYDPANNAWSHEAPLPTPRGALAAATGPDGRIYAVGGYIGGNAPIFDTAIAEAYTPLGLTNPVPSVLSAPDRTAEYGSTTTLAAHLRTGPAMPISGRSIQFVVDGTPLGSAVSDATGTARLSYQVPVDAELGRDIPFTLSFAGDSAYGASMDSGLIHPQPGRTRLSMPGVAAIWGTSVTFTATLVHRGTAAPISGETVSFAVDGNNAGSAATDGAGMASLVYPIAMSLGVGDQVVTISYAGGARWLASSDTSRLRVQSRDSAVIASPVEGAPGSAVTLTGGLADAISAVPLNGRTLLFEVNTGTGFQSVGSAMTDASGQATVSFTLPATRGSSTLRVRFAGDVAYGASSDTARLKAR